MASGDSRRSSKTKKISSSVSSNDDDYQYMCPHESHVLNSPTKLNRNSSNQNVPNPRFNANALFEDVVAHEETRKKVRAFSDDGSVIHSLSSLNYPIMQPTSAEFSGPLSPIYSNPENPNIKSVKDESRKNLVPRVHRSDRNIEDRTNKSNRMVEKKQSEDRLMAQKMQEVKLQKKISGQIKKQQGYPINQVSGSNKIEVSQVNETYDQCVSYASQNVGPQPHYPGEKSFYEIPDSQSSKYLLSCIDSLRKRMCNMEHSQDDKNMIATSLNPQESSISGHQHNGFELTRKKLKNKLVELEEKKMMNDELVRILPQLQEDTNLDSPDNSALVSKPSQRKPKADLPPKPLRIETRDGRRRNIHSSSATKRDNVRKEINSSFPVRRHYEAEGRANEDPIAPNPGPPNPNKNSGKPNVNLSRETFNKIKLIEDRGGYTEDLNDILHAYFNQDRIGVCFSEKDLNTQLDEMLVNNVGDEEEYGEEGYEGGYEENQEEEEIEEENELNEINENSEEAECSGGNQNRIIVSDLNNAENEEEPQVNSAVNMCERVDHLDLAVRKNEYLVHNLYRHLLDTNDKPGDLDAFLKNTKGIMQNFSTQYSDFEDEALTSQGDNSIRSSGEGSFNVNRSSGSVNPRFTENNQPAHATNRNCSSISNSSDNLSLHTVKRNPSNILSSLPDNTQSSHYLQNSHRRENLQLTQQNITNTESQSRGLDRNLHKKDSSSRKKDNNLSDKMVRFRFPAARNSVSEEQDATKESLDSISTQRLEQNPSHIGETERKTILDILKREKKSDKVYDRNQDIRNSSRFHSDFEPNANPNSAFFAVAAPMNVSNPQIFDDGHIIQDQHRNHQTNPRVYSESRPKGNANMRTPEAANFPTDFYPWFPVQNDTAREQGYQQQQVPLNFIQQLQRQFSELFQSPVSQGHPASCQNSNQNLNTFPSMQPMPIPCNSYYHQLLLCLTQCYHTMYVQQLEIQQLQHALHHGFSADVYHSVNSLNAHSGSESVEIRPCNLAAWSNPLSISTFPHDPPPPPAFSPAGLFNEFEHEHLKYYPPLEPELGTGIPTIRQCNLRQSPPPSYEEKDNSGETLNNQVPPRTRANNFLDNFRSYSRLNLLSASTNVKRNEASQSQVNSSVNESSHYCQDDITTDGSITENERPTRDPESPVLNAELQAFRNRSKKANSEPTASANVKYKVLENPKKSSLTNFNPEARNILPERIAAHRESTVQPVPHSPSINLIQLQGQEDSKLGNFSSILPTSTISASGASEVPASEFVINLYKEAKLLTNEAERLNALKLIRDIVLSDKSEITQSKIRNDYIAFSSKEEQASNEASAPPVESSSIDSTCISDKTNSEVINQSSIDNTSVLSSQNMPSASASPINKPISTGAVRKKPKTQKASYSDTSYACASYDAVMRDSISEEVNKMLDADYSKYVANLCALEVKSLFQSFCNPSRDEIFTSKVCSTLNSFVISKVANHVKMPSKCYSSLYNALEMVTDCICGKKFSDCEGLYADKVFEVLHKSLNSFFSNGQFNLSDVCLLGDDDLPQLENDFNEVDLCNAAAEKNFPQQRASISNEAGSLSLQPILIENSNLDLSENRNDLQPVCAIPNVENDNLWNECEIEAEIEVEAGAEADLAEADQSPGQQGNITLGSFSAAIVNLDSEVVSSNSVAAAAGPFAALNGTDNETISDTNQGAHNCPDTTNDQDICPDDIPTKLCSNLEKEPKEEIQICMSSTDDTKDEVSSSGGNCDPE